VTRGLFFRLTLRVIGVFVILAFFDWV